MEDVSFDVPSGELFIADFDAGLIGAVIEPGVHIAAGARSCRRDQIGLLPKVDVLITFW